MKIFLDTNVVLAFLVKEEARHVVVTDMIQHLIKANSSIAISPQIVFETWATLTRPTTANGFGKTIPDAQLLVNALLQCVEILSVGTQSCHYWYDFVSKHQAKGRQTYDTAIAAVVAEYHLDHLITYNIKDFQRFSGITAITPEDYLAQT